MLVEDDVLYCIWLHFLRPKILLYVLFSPILFHIKTRRFTLKKPPGLKPIAYSHLCNCMVTLGWLAYVVGWEECRWMLSNQLVFGWRVEGEGSHVDTVMWSVDLSWRRKKKINVQQENMEKDFLVCWFPGLRMLVVQFQCENSIVVCFKNVFETIVNSDLKEWGN